MNRDSRTFSRAICLQPITGLDGDVDGVASVPSSLRIFPMGTVAMKDGDTYLCDAESMREIVDRFRKRGIDLVIDYEHQTEGGDYSSPDGTAPAAGWVKDLEDRGPDGLWASVQWNDRALKLLEAREYRYFSPVFLYEKQTGKIVELMSIALTNTPRTIGIPPIVAKDRNSNQKEISMEFLKSVAKALGLAETSTEEQVLDELVRNRMERRTGVSASITGALGLADTATESEVVATIHAIRQRPDLSEEIASLKSRLAERDRDDLVAEAMTAGKITPAQKEWAEAYALNDPEGFRVFIAKAPVVVPVAPMGIQNKSNSEGIDGDSDEAILKIAKMFGHTLDDIKKYGFCN